jgi:hypothetical protein
MVEAAKKGNSLNGLHNNTMPSYRPGSSESNQIKHLLTTYKQRKPVIPFYH